MKPIKDTNTNGSQLFLNEDGSRTSIHDRPKPPHKGHKRGKPKRKPKPL